MRKNLFHICDMLLRRLGNFPLLQMLQKIRLHLRDIRIAFLPSSIHAGEVITSAAMDRASRLNCPFKVAFGASSQQPSSFKFWPGKFDSSVFATLGCAPILDFRI